MLLGGGRQSASDRCTARGYLADDRRLDPKARVSKMHWEPSSERQFARCPKQVNAHTFLKIFLRFVLFEGLDSSVYVEINGNFTFSALLVLDDYHRVSTDIKTWATFSRMSLSCYRTALSIL